MTLMKFNIEQYFENLINYNIIFKNRDALNTSYIPDSLPHRDTQIKLLAQIFGVSLKNAQPSNVFIYGKTGTGKTAVVKFVTKKLINKFIDQKIESVPKWIYINCNEVRTSYRILATILNRLEPREKIPPTGFPRDILIEKLYNIMENQIKNSICFIILDEIDCLTDINSKNNILYILSRLNETIPSAKVCIIGISNLLDFKKDLDPRILSSLSEEEIVFPSYNAKEIYDILIERVSVAFIPNIVDDGALKLCSALAAEENGDARRALSILRKAAELVERRNLNKLNVEHIYEAKEILDLDTTVEFLKELPVQQKYILFSIYLNHKYNPDVPITTGLLYNTYCELINKGLGMNVLTPRRVTSLVKDLELAGIIRSDLISKGKPNGRTRYIYFLLSDKQIKKAFEKDPEFEDFLNYIPDTTKNKNYNYRDGMKFQTLI